MPEKIVERSSKDMYIEDMTKYSIIINRRRAIPEIKDGLKPVQRRIIFDMFETGATSYGRRKKSAKIVGDTMGNYHTHGDSAIYGAMDPLANWWKSKMPLIAPHGNWGTVMGDSPAAMRYTEAGLSDFGYECVIGEMADAKYVVDYIDNYNRERKEPEFLPAKVPLILINGSFGIGLGITTSIPTHNLVEVLEATRKMIKNPNYHVVLVPDHCQPLIIFDTDWSKISDMGYGKYTVRGIVEKYEENGYPIIAIRSLPDNVTTQNVVDKLMSLVDQKQLPMVKDIIDASKGNVDIRVILKKGSDVNYVEEIIYSKTSVQDNISVNFEVVDGINHMRLSYTEYIKKFLEFRAITKFRLYCNKYKSSSTRLHKLETFIKFIESGEIDNIIAMVKKQKTTDDTELTEYLIKKLNITDLQAGFILSTDIRYLSKGHLERYKSEYKELSTLQSQYRKAITDNGEIIMGEIDAELEYIEKKYGSPRLCKVVEPISENNIPKGTFKIIITEKNYIRKIPDNDKIGVVKGDNPRYILRVENTENIILFDNKGKCFKLPVYKVPVTDRSSAGTDVRIMVKNLTADIIQILYEPAIKHIVEGLRKHYLVVVTKNNVIKRLDLEDFLNVNASGLLYSKIPPTDEVTGLMVAAADLDIIIYSNQKALRCRTVDIPLLKRNASGSRAMNTADPIEGLSAIYPNTEYIVVVTNRGKFNKFPINCLSTHTRGKAGNNVIKLDDNDYILELYGACDSDVVRITTADGVEEVRVSDIKSKSGIASGQKMIKSRNEVIKSELIYNINN